MAVKRTLAVILSVIMLFSLVACQKDDDADENQGSTTTTTTMAFDEDITVNTTSPATQPSDSSALSDENPTSAESTQPVSDNPADWNTAQVIDFYKKAASKSNSSATSEQVVTIAEISVNDGEYEGLFNFVTPIMSKLLENNTQPKQGITGGYSYLSEADVKSAKAYRDGDKTIVEINLKDQVAGPKEDAMSGSVGHGVTAVGDISVVVDEMKDLGLPLELSDTNTKIYYTGAQIKVVVDSNRNIVNGTWFYRASIKLTDYKAFGKPVNSTCVVLDNKITVNGGFSK